MKRIICLLILILLISGCSNYNAELICYDFCGGEPIMESQGFIGYYIKCTSPTGWNLSSYSEGSFEVKCDVSG